MSRDLTFDDTFEHLYVATQTTVSPAHRPGSGHREGSLGRDRDPYVGEATGFWIASLRSSLLSQLVKVPVAPCAQHLDCESCLAHKDPYCGWCVLLGRSVLHQLLTWACTSVTALYKMLDLVHGLCLKPPGSP